METQGHERLMPMNPSSTLLHWLLATRKGQQAQPMPANASLHTQQRTLLALYLHGHVLDV